MSKRLTMMLLMLLGAVLFLALTSNAEVKLIATKVEFSGEVKLAWTKPAGATDATVYQLFRAKLPDSTGVMVASTSDTVIIDKTPLIISATTQSYRYHVLAVTGTSIEQSNYLFVQVPGFPSVGSFRAEANVEMNNIKVTWSKPPVEQVSYYIVYRGLLADNAPAHEIVDTTTMPPSITPIPAWVPQGTYVSFIFYVRAVLPSGEIITSTSAHVGVYKQLYRDDVTFVSRPPMTGQVGVPYVYTAQAVSSDSGAEIRYFAPFRPNGFSIDSVTGIVNWTPSAKGYYGVTLYAKSNKGDVEFQKFTVTVAGGNGSIQGKVTDTLNIPIPGVIVEIFKAENNLSLSFAYTVKTDANGNYRAVRVDPGNYKLRANSPTGRFQSQWYDGKREASQADIVIVVDSPAVSTANFRLRGGASIHPKIAVKGRVTDTAGIAINNAETRVVFVRADFAFNFGGGMNAGIENFRKYFDMNMHGDFRLEGNSEFVFKAKVDSTGKYSLSLPPGGYIAFARAKGYATEFYYEESSILSADVIRIPDPKVPPMEPSFDFTLSPLPPIVLGVIKGLVMDTVKNMPVPARILAFRDNWRFSDMHSISRVTITDTDSSGQYVLDDLLPGKYVILALPLGNYSPAFYSNDTVNTRWKRATKVEVNGNTVDGIDIVVKPLGPSASGYTGITGTVSMNGNGGNMNGKMRAGAIVYAYRNNEIAGYGFTNAEGNFLITGLSPGQYSVFADKPGYEESSSATVNAYYDLTGNPMGGTVNLTMNATLDVTAHTETAPVEYVLEQNYPNPFNPSTSIRFSLPNAGITSLKVYNVVGQEMATLLEEFKDAGQYTVTFDASKFSSGVYFYRLETGSFHQVRKMLLIK